MPPPASPQPAPGPARPVTGVTETGLLGTPVEIQPQGCNRGALLGRLGVLVQALLAAAAFSTLMDDLSCKVIGDLKPSNRVYQVIVNSNEERWKSLQTMEEQEPGICGGWGANSVDGVYHFNFKRFIPHPSPCWYLKLQKKLKYAPPSLGDSFYYGMPKKHRIYENNRLLVLVLDKQDPSLTGPGENTPANSAYVLLAWVKKACPDFHQRIRRQYNYMEQVQNGVEHASN